MDLAELLEGCTAVLTDVDVRKICRHRGFSAEEAWIGTLLRHLLLSEAWTVAEDLEVAVRQHFHADLVVHAHPRTWSASTPTQAHLPTTEAICQAGWSVGFLERCPAQGRTWYRLAAPACSPGAKALLEEALSTEAEDSIQVELEVVPFEILEALTTFSRFAVEGRHLVARPDPVVIGRMQEGGRRSSPGCVPTRPRTVTCASGWPGWPVARCSTSASWWRAFARRSSGCGWSRH